MADRHLMYCSEQSFSTGTWGGAVLIGFTVRCGSCKKFFVVEEYVVRRGGSIYSIAGVQDLTCPYCNTRLPTSAEQSYILETKRWSED